MKKKKELIIKHLGSLDAVTASFYKNKRSFVYKCPECGQFISEKLSRHLEIKHGKDHKEARLIQTKLRVFYLWCNADKHNTHLPLPCEPCGEWHLRLDKHLTHDKAHKLQNEENRYPILAAAREKYWMKQEKYDESEEEDAPNPNEFIMRSKPPPNKAASEHRMKQRLKSPDPDYAPGKAVKLTQEDMNKWNIKEDDFFSLHFKSNEDLMDLFQDSLEATSGNKMAIQHRNQVELIWSTLDKDMKMFPNSLSNIHLFRDCYHLPNFKLMGKKEGVQAGTLRSRYTSLGYFLSFLRKYGIYAGMNRLQIQLLETTMDDFNKTLNNPIKQRKVEIRMNKRKNLLQASHFIKFGQSSFVQNLLNAYRTKKSNFTIGFAQDFRNYIIATLVIGNGLRSSNILELRLSDFDEHTTVNDYPDHKIIVNDTYKTSTIYGEKFIVVPDKLYEHYKFYEQNLRPLLCCTKSKKAFIVNGENPSMTQTNVAASLSSAFKKAKVFSTEEYQLVSCTRIRCGLATFACNEGGFETAFFATHFMKNREETTARHYNLHANRRHALNIAMKLYDTFNGKSINIDKDDIEKLFLPPSVPKDNVLKWLKKNDPHLSKAEIKEFTEALESYEERLSSTSPFYGTSKPVKECMDTNSVDSGIQSSVSAECMDTISIDFGVRSSVSTTIDNEQEKRLEELCQTPKRKKGDFTKEHLQALKKTCGKFIFFGNITEEEVMQAVSTETILQKFTFQKLRQKIAYLRIQLQRTGEVTAKKKPKKKVEDEGNEEEEEEISSSDEEDSESDEKSSSDDKNDDVDVNKEDIHEFVKNRNEDERNNKIGYTSGKDKEKFDGNKEGKDSNPIVVASKVMSYCDEHFSKDKTRSLRKRRLSNQIEKAKRFSVLGTDQEGFRKMFIKNHIDGFGVFAMKAFCKGEFLLQYGGTLLSAEEGNKQDSQNQSGNFFFFFSDEHKGKKRDFCLDGTTSNLLCKYVNDSPSTIANCRMNRIKDDEGAPYLCLFAKQDIAVGEELRYDYGPPTDELWWRKQPDCLKPIQLNEGELSKLSDTDSDDIIPPSPKKQRKEIRKNIEEKTIVQKQAAKSFASLVNQRKSARKQRENSLPYSNWIKKHGKEYLEKIAKAEIKSTRHCTFFKGSQRERDELKYNSGFGPISDDVEVDTLLDLLQEWHKPFKKASFNTLTYIYDVWFPEVVVAAIKNVNGCTEKEAEEIYWKGSF